jgi:hypothetical protein
MATRLTWSIFKGCSLESLHDALQAAAVEQGGHIQWNTEGEAGTALWIASLQEVHTLQICAYSSYRLVLAAATKLQTPWMELRLQESSLWDYSLMLGAADVCEFSTFPTYWGPDFSARGKPEPRLFAKTWNVPYERIFRYHVQWATLIPWYRRLWHWWVRALGHDVYETTGVGGKAYPEDQFEYGDCYQVNDFLRAIGGLDPAVHGQRHRILNIKF